MDARFAAVQNPAMKSLRALLAVLLVLSACARQSADSPGAVAERFYDFYLAQKMNNGLPSIEQCRQMAPLLSRGLQDAIGRARREQDKYRTEHPGDKPPWVEGDLFSSLFEGATAYEIGPVDLKEDHADVAVTLHFEDAGNRSVSWTDRLVLVRENEHWVVEDLEYGGNWDFANHGSLRQSLLSEAEPTPPPAPAAPTGKT